MGLSIELVVIVLLFFNVMSVGMIMQDAFRSLFLGDGWRSMWFLGAAGIVGLGVLLYMIIFAPLILAREQQVGPGKTWAQCRVPYLLYAPYSLVMWVVLVLPLVAMVVTSINLDHTSMSNTVIELNEHSGHVAGLADNTGHFELEKLVYYRIEYQESIATIQQVVNRYLWVVGTFMVFLIIVLNTQITTIFTEEALDFFKWLMWLLLAIAFGIGFFGLWRFFIMRSLAIDSISQLLSVLHSADALPEIIAAKNELLTLRAEATIYFLRQTMEGGSLWLLFFGYGAQIVLAKVSNRSLVKTIFPRNIAQFLDSFIELDKES